MQIDTTAPRKVKKEESQVDVEMIDTQPKVKAKPDNRGMEIERRMEIDRPIVQAIDPERLRKAQDIFGEDEEKEPAKVDPKPAGN